MKQELNGGRSCISEDYVKRQNQTRRGGVQVDSTSGSNKCGIVGVAIVSSKKCRVIVPVVYFLHLLLC